MRWCVNTSASTTARVNGTAATGTATDGASRRKNTAAISATNMNANTASRRSRDLSLSRSPVRPNRRDRLSSIRLSTGLPAVPARTAVRGRPNAPNREKMISTADRAR